MSNVARQLGVNLEFRKMRIETINGAYNRETNTILLNQNLSTAEMAWTVFAHEITHAAETAGAYEQVRDIAKRHAAQFVAEGQAEEAWNATIDELRRDPWSRRAVMDIRTPADMGSPDPACWQHVQYFLRDGALHCKILFRSNDACKATFMNAFALILLQKRIADALGVRMGTYTHRANSFHCYERDFAMLDGYCARIRAGEVDCERDDLTFSYADDWAEQMADAQEEIAAKVEALKMGSSER